MIKINNQTEINPMVIDQTATTIEAVKDQQNFIKDQIGKEIKDQLILLENTDTKITEVKQDVEDKEKTKASKVHKVDYDKLSFQSLVEKVNEFVSSTNTKLTFKFEDGVDRPIITVLDEETGETIRQIPPDNMIELINKLEDMSGIIYQGKA